MDKDVTEPRSIAVELARPIVNTPALDAAGLRRGMWVMSELGRAILTGCGNVTIKEGVYSDDGDTEVEPPITAVRAIVTLVKPDGTTLMELANDKAVPAERAVSVSSLRMAFIEEIPESRFESVEQLRGLGYTSVSEAA